MNIIGHAGNGPVFHAIEHAGYAYAGQGTELRIYDIRTPAATAAVTRTNYSIKIDVGTAIKILKVHNGRLFVLTKSKLLVYNISNPAIPVKISEWKYSGTIRMWEHTGISMKGDYAYISSYDVGIIILKIVNDVPQFIKILALRDALMKEYDYWYAEKNRPRRSVISGNNLIFGTTEMGGSVFIVDITNPEGCTIDTTKIWKSPNERAHISSVAVVGGYIYVIEYRTAGSEGKNGLRVLDMNLNEVKNFLGDYRYNDIYIYGTTAYISVRYGAYDTYNVTSPGNPTKIGSYTTPVPGYNEGIYVSDKGIFLSGGTMGWYIFSLANAFIVKIPVVGGARSLEVQENKLFVGAQNDGPWMFDMSDPAAPVELDYTYNSGRIEMLQVDGNNLYVPGDWTQMSIYGISTNKFTTILFRYGDACSHLLKDGKLVYAMLYQSDEVIAYDVSVPSAPTVAKGKVFIGAAGKMLKYGNYILACGAYSVSSPPNLGLHIIDVTGIPVIKKTYMPGTKVDDICLIGNVCYAVGGNDIWAIDLTDPLNPVQKSHLNYVGDWSGRCITSVPAENLIFAGGGAYEGQVKRIDVTDPTNMKWTEDIIFPEFVEGILYDPHSGLFIVADYTCGVYFVDTVFGTVPYKYTCIDGVCTPGMTGPYSTLQDCLDAGCSTPPPPPPPPEEEESNWWWILILILLYYFSRKKG